MEAMPQMDEHDNKTGSQKQGGWTPIESAPKDGTWIDAWRDPPGDTGGYWEPRVTVRWDDEAEEWVWPDQLYEVFTERGIDRANNNIIDEDFYSSSEFTHWMPLPGPPPRANPSTDQGGE